jgi:hypothetical protein
VKRPTLYRKAPRLSKERAELILEALFCLGILAFMLWCYGTKPAVFF